MTELEILKLAQDGDQAAFKKIFVTYRYPIFFMINQMIKDSTVAEDLTMETFEKAFKDIKKFVPNYKLISWISKIGKNKTLDYIRAKNLRPKSVELDYMLQDHYTPEHELIGKERTEIFETAITHLNGNYKKIFMMRLEGAKCKEIAEKLNVPINTVVGYIRESRKKILLEQSKVDRIKTPKPPPPPETIEKAKKVYMSKRQLNLEEKEYQKEYQKRYREINKKRLAEYHKKYQKKYTQKKKLNTKSI